MEDSTLSVNLHYEQRQLGQEAAKVDTMQQYSTEIQRLHVVIGVSLCIAEYEWSPLVSRGGARRLEPGPCTNPVKMRGAYAPRVEQHQPGAFNSLTLYSADIIRTRQYL